MALNSPNTHYAFGYQATRLASHHFPLAGTHEHHNRRHRYRKSSPLFSPGDVKVPVTANDPVIARKHAVFNFVQNTTSDVVVGTDSCGHGAVWRQFPSGHMQLEFHRPLDHPNDRNKEFVQNLTRPYMS